MTRARRHLFLTRASHYEGGRRWRDSRFLDEVRAAGPRAICERTFDAAPPLQQHRMPAARPGEVVLSYSAIAAYRDCPRQYWYRQEQRLPAVQSAEAVHGVIQHEVLRQAGEARKSGREVTAGALKSIHRGGVGA